jgi:hypothetical protein
MGVNDSIWIWLFSCGTTYNSKIYPFKLTVLYLIYFLLHGALRFEKSSEVATATLKIPSSSITRNQVPRVST